TAERARTRDRPPCPSLRGGGGMSLRVLCVDDEPKVLDAMELHVGMEYDLETAPGGADGLKLLKSDGPFDVVVSDMRMPGMDGAEFLSRVSREAPETSRILLTGQTDMDSAIRAVNEGHIFRFLTKPCPPEVLLRSIGEAGELAQLRRVEQDLLDNTVRGCVEVLADVMAVSVPAMSQRDQSVRTLASRLAKHVAIPREGRWELEVAASLVGMGSIALPHEVLDRAWRADQSLEASDQALLEQIPAVGSRLLRKVPRLEGAADLIGKARATLRPWVRDDEAQLRVLEIALWASEQALHGTHWDAVKHQVAREVSGEVADALGSAPRGLEVQAEEREVMAAELTSEMVLLEDAKSRKGQCLVRAATPLTDALVARLQSFATGAGLQEPLRVSLGKPE
ncbi:MAG: response regulator, partial [Pseudomonadota bacterium]